MGTFLVVHLLRICLLLLGMRVPFLVGELRMHKTWTHAPQLESPCDARKKPTYCNKRPSTAKKINKINKMLGEGWISKAQSFKRTGWKNGGHFALGQGLVSDACHAGDLGLIPGQKDPLEKGMATHSCILDWRTA